MNLKEFWGKVWLRNVQRIGKSTFSINLPKRWAEAVNLEAGSRVLLSAQPPDLLVVRPERPDQLSSTTLDITGRTGDALVREIISAYVAGFDVIRLQARGPLTAEQLETVRQISQALTGLDIKEDAVDAIVIRSILDPVKLPVWETLQEIYAGALAMFSDSIAALKTLDRQLAKNVIARDKEIDRKFLMLSRQFRTALRDFGVEEQLQIRRTQFFDWHTSARQLERVADHAVKIATVAASLKAKLPPSMIRALEEAGELAIEIVQRAMEALEKLNFELANLAINEGSRVDERLLKLGRLLRDLEPAAASLLSIALDSVRRVKDYGANIAEVAMNAAAPDFHGQIPNYEP